MKQAILFCLFTICSFQAFSQCTPNEMYRDSAVGIYPPPLSADNPDGGITESACIDSGYEFVLTFKIPATLVFNGVELPLNSITVDETMGGVGGLPEGLGYECNPSDCVFTPADTLACIVINGTATDANAPGDYPLSIATIVNLGALGDIPLTFPNMLIPGADGEYILTLDEAGGGDCFIASTDDYISENIRVTNSPNPFGSITNIQVYSEINEDLNFYVYDMLGNIVHQREVTVQQGQNNFEFDGAHLANGIYTFSLSNHLGAVTRKIVVSR